MRNELSQIEAEEVINSLRQGIPPRRNVSSYASGLDFAGAVSKRHFASGIGSGKIRWVCGNWGSGKTHFLRLLAEEAFASNLLVSNVQLSADQTPFNKFEKVFFEIVRNVTSLEMYQSGEINDALPFGQVLKGALFKRSEIEGGLDNAYRKLSAELMAQTEIDIDFRQIVKLYWGTFLSGGADSQDLELKRARLLNWFEGEGTVGSFRRDYGINKIISKENARIILASLGAFIKWLGYAGLVILFDEAEMTHSTMRKSSLRQAHNNLLHLVNEIEACQGLFLIYATVPDFFEDPRHGIQIYGALATRIGKLGSSSPLPLDKVWNIDAIESADSDFTDAAEKIYGIYLKAFEGETQELMSQEELANQIDTILSERPEFSAISSWRLAITATIETLDKSLQGASIPSPKDQYADIMKRLPDE
jgi:hypothetical protein